jgi:hypothetical protein
LTQDSALSLRTIEIPGGLAGGVPPVPIPNTEVKPSRVDATAAVRQWESRTLPGYKQSPLVERSAGFCFSTTGQRVFLSGSCRQPARPSSLHPSPRGEPLTLRADRLPGWRHPQDGSLTRTRVETSTLISSPLVGEGRVRGSDVSVREGRVTGRYLLPHGDRFLSGKELTQPM